MFRRASMSRRVEMLFGRTEAASWRSPKPTTVYDRMTRSCGVSLNASRRTERERQPARTTYSLKRRRISYRRLTMAGVSVPPALDQDVLVAIDVFEDLSRSAHDSSQRVFGHVYGEARFEPEAFIQSLQERP